MSSPITSSMWMEDSDPLSDFEPSLMTTAICPMSVFDKFGWDSEILGPDTDELLDKICIKSEPEEILDDKSNLDFGSLSSIFPDLIDDTKNSLDIDCLKSILSPPHDNSFNLFDDEKLDIKVDPIVEPIVEPIVPPMPLPVPVNEIKSELVEEKEASNSIIRIPVKRSPGSVNPNFSKPGTGRTVKAVVVCPDRSKSIVCNVVRSSNNKGIIIQKTVGRSLLNLCGPNQRNEPKLPIKVNVISSKEAIAKIKAARNESENKLEPVITAPVMPVAPVADIKVKTEYEEVRPETPLSLIGSDEEFNPFASPSKSPCKSLDLQDNFIKSCLLEEDNLCSESYKCMPPAEVTGQVQPSIPDIFKYTPNSSPTSTEMQSDSLDTFYSKITSNNGQSQFYNKAAANVDHDYGFTCRTPKTNTIFADSLGIQTPSASEPPTDSDDDDAYLGSDSTLVNDYECSELDREQNEYFEQLKRQLKMAELMSKSREKEGKTKATVGSGVKERKNAARNRKRKSSSNKDKGTPDAGHGEATKIKISLSSAARNDIMKFSTASTTTGMLKVRLPAKDANGNTPKRRKTSSGGRVFSPSERHLHNTNEQVRRIEMRQSFEELRRLIPKLYDKPRAPKVAILQEAKIYCDELFHTDCKMQAQVTALKCQQERLRTTLSQLRRCAAASRY